MSAVVSVTEPRLRPMQEEDVAAVLDIERAAYEFPWTRAIFRDCLRVGYTCYVYEGAPGLLGHGIMSLAVGECHLLNICIHPKYQRRGLGQALIVYLLDLARVRRATVALLEVRVSNRAAYNLYLKMGFDEVGLRKAYYPARSGREDAIILARDLTIDPPPPRDSSSRRAAK